MTLPADRNATMTIRFAAGKVESINYVTAPLGQEALGADTSSPH